jgi:putative N-acetylmannosamine-6-phosphate epimerase
MNFYLKGKRMKRIVEISITVMVLMGTFGCTHHNPQNKRYLHNKAKNQQFISNAYNSYKKYKNHKAIAISIDEIGNCVVGYSYHAKTQEKANKQAIKKCMNAKHKLESKSKAQCEIYAIGDKIVGNIK